MKYCQHIAENRAGDSVTIGELFEERKAADLKTSID